MTSRIEHIRVGMRRNGASVKLKLRWDNSPKTCELVSAALPLEEDMWHAKYANHEIYVLLPVVEVFGEDPPGEWQCMYPAPGDLMYLFHPPGLLPKDIYSPDNPRRIVDVAYFYDRGITYTDRGVQTQAISLLRQPLSMTWRILPRHVLMCGRMDSWGSVCILKKLKRKRGYLCWLPYSVFDKGPFPSSCLCILFRHTSKF